MLHSSVRVPGDRPGTVIAYNPSLQKVTVKLAGGEEWTGSVTRVVKGA
jgi:hypothetical protein